MWTMDIAIQNALVPLHRAGGVQGSPDAWFVGTVVGVGQMVLEQSLRSSLF